MSDWKDEENRDQALQYIFTAYLQSAFARRRQQYINKQNRIQAHESPCDPVFLQDCHCGPAGMEGAPLCSHIAQVDRALERLVSHDLLLAAVLALPERGRRLLYLRAVLEQPFRSIAGELGISEGAAKKAYARTLRRLRAELGGARE